MFLFGTLLCGLAPTLGLLIFGRVLEGLGACAGVVLARIYPFNPVSESTVLAASGPEAEQAVRAIGALVADKFREGE